MASSPAAKRAIILAAAAWLAALPLPRSLGAEPADHGAAPLPPALEPASTGGVAAVDRALARLSGHRRLLVVGAHPDDEDNSLLAWVTREGGDAAYLSLSRGEGGQNLVGSELGFSLGLLRTGELLAARQVDGARQLFTRAFDFGYTRSLEETVERWPHSLVLEDAVRAVRRFRPQVIVAIFPPDERAGHGQHQMSAVIAEAVIAAAGYPDRYPALTAAGLPPWTPNVFFRRAWRGDEATHRFSLDGVEPFSGRSVSQLAAASRSQHRSQDMGREQPIGGGAGGLIELHRMAGAPGSVASTEGAPGPFDRIDTRLAGLAAPLAPGGARERLEQRLGCIEHLARSLRARLAAAELEAAVPELAVLALALDAALADLASGEGGLEGSQARAGVAALLREKRAAVGSALLAAAGVAVDAVVDRESMVAGSAATATLSVWNGGGRALRLESLRIADADGWEARPLAPAEGDRLGELPEDLPPTALRHARFEVRADGSLAPTRPYFVAGPVESSPAASATAGLLAPVGDLYDWSAAPESVRGEPWGPAPLNGRFELDIAGVALSLERELVHRTGDQALGEVRRPLRVVPGIEVSVEPARLVRPLTNTAPRLLEVRLRSHLDRAVVGRLVLSGELGWAESAPAFDLEPGGRWARTVSIAPPAVDAPGIRRASVVALLDSGERYASAAPVVEYPHTRPVAFEQRAGISLHSLDLSWPPIERLGFVVGASEQLPKELEAIGLPVERLDAHRLSGDLSGYDAIVIGSRAYETDPLLERVNGHLLDYARSGGLLIVLYQQYAFAQGGFAPYPLTIARPHGRVTDEASPVAALAPEHPVFHHPNAIVAEDWEGWVQERGLYFADTWDGAYTPLLALRDEGHPEQRGALLVAPVGKGTWVYTGLAFFRQLPAGVPGAWRLFANLLALPRGEEGAH